MGTMFLRSNGEPDFFFQHFALFRFFFDRTSKGVNPVMRIQKSIWLIGVSTSRVRLFLGPLRQSIGALIGLVENDISCDIPRSATPLSNFTVYQRGCTLLSNTRIFSDFRTPKVVCSVAMDSNSNESLLDSLEHRPSVVHVANLANGNNLNGIDLAASFDFTNGNSIHPIAMPTDNSKNKNKSTGIY